MLAVAAKIMKFSTKISASKESLRLIEQFCNGAFYDYILLKASNADGAFKIA